MIIRLFGVVRVVCGLFFKILTLDHNPCHKNLMKMTTITATRNINVGFSQLLMVNE